MARCSHRLAPLSLALAAGTIVLAFAAGPGLAARRIVLFEESTNWGCPPCYTANPTIHQFLDDYSVAQVVAVKWHVWWPASNDPIYLHNSAPVQSRIGYYGINAAPDITVDGQNGPIPGSYGSMQTWVENRLAISSPIAVSATGVINGTNYDVSIDVNVEQALPAGDYRLFCVLEEHHKYLVSPNGETDHYDIFRHSVATTGEAINLGSVGNQHFNRSLAFDAQEAPAELQAVVWVQNYPTREVLNAATTWPPPAQYLRLAGGTPGVLNDPNTIAGLTRDVVNLGTQNDTYDISVSTLTGHLPPGWTYEYQTSQGIFTGPSTLPLASGASETIQVRIDSHGIAGGGLVELTFTSQGNPAVVRTQRFSKVSNPTVLVYDDDGGASYDALLTTGLDAAGIGWGLWDDGWGKLTGAQLATAPVLFWGCGLSYPTLDPTDRPAITAFLSGGGKAFFNGQEIGWELNDGTSGNYDLTWYRNNLHAQYLVDAAGYALTGIAGDPIGDGLSYTLQYANQPYPDGVATYGAGSVVSVQYNATYKGVIRWDSGASSKLVYMSHGIEGITNPQTVITIIQRVIDWFGVAAGVPEPASAPAAVALDQNYPNPFNPSTAIPYALGQPGRVRLAVYDVGGRLVRELVSGSQPAGPHVAVWDGRDAAGRALGSGTYFYRLEGPSLEATRSMVLIK